MSAGAVGGGGRSRRRGPSALHFVGCRFPVCDEGEFAEITFGNEQSAVLSRNLATAEVAIHKLFTGLESQCIEERQSYNGAGQTPSPQKRNRWMSYIGASRIWDLTASSMHFIKHFPECRTRLLSEQHLRFLVFLQHLVAEDTRDFYRPVGDRQHCDTFEGEGTFECINTQLIKDAHRSEWCVDGTTYVLKAREANDGYEDRKSLIASFQKELVIELENFLMAFCRRRNLSEIGGRKLSQAVTTQMSQCGLANLDRSSKAGTYFVSGQGLDQRITYSLSSMQDNVLGESLQLTMLCMKTCFTQYHRADMLQMQPGDGPEDEQNAGPMRCDPSSYLYQYATLRFTPKQMVDGCEQTECVVIDALDEVHILPVKPGGDKPTSS
eukprot:TRINITY_DN4014_c0_g2_i1.p1 TRINITY_DN4014_c0_g2~~TRINITY_DN4014_c0_g2_i1.p1  ORF type:complete len:381 (+),score=51.26 TRINITY_DN4014_c0_g2_i1:218-1360(+)